ncbi:MAG: hypothetical protein K0B02_00605 [DPANN group archaeon]|nr:hypothetical protein [DPANN group archaeon]
MDMNKIKEMIQIAKQKNNFNELMRLQKIKALNSPEYVAPFTHNGFMGTKR